MLSQHAPMTFDLSKPFGPVKDDTEARVSLKRCQFIGTEAPGYNQFIACTAFVKGPEHPTVHVASFKLSNMVQDHGLNAIALILRNEEDGTPLLEPDEWNNYMLTIRSQWCAPFETSIWTLVVFLDKKTVRLYMQDGRTGGTGKRKHEDDPQWYFPTAADKNSTVEHTDGEMTFWVKEWEILELRDPIVCFRMCGALQNIVDIVPVPRAVTDHLGKIDRVVYS
eukprot:3040940-Prymnesium_polylepis.1